MIAEIDGKIVALDVFNLETGLSDFTFAEREHFDAAMPALYRQEQAWTGMAPGLRHHGADVGALSCGRIRGGRGHRDDPLGGSVTVLTVYPTAGGDSGSQSATSGTRTVTINNATNLVAYVSAQTYPISYAGHRFESITIDASATVSSATLSVYGPVPSRPRCGARSPGSNPTRDSSPRPMGC